MRHLNALPGIVEIMPTPFTHLQIAEQIRRQVVADGRSPDGRLAELLQTEWPAFYLGSVAPDVQTISGAPRPQTHFYDIPPAPDSQAYPLMLATYPELADAATLLPAQAVFVAAYNAHLLLDLVWYRQISLPYFVDAAGLGSRDHRRLLHHTLLTYLDKQAYLSLPDTAVTTLAAAQPAHWLPFVTDADLLAWRDLLVAQLQPGAALQTAAVYAGRLHLSPAILTAYVDDPTWLHAHLFRSIPLDQVQAQLATAVGASVQCVKTYLQPMIGNQ
ncbi:MAG: hypothetical protein IAE79_02405 [Anaerolinea sp.]|nr:hypothetical protein [Anaerolinea sp.]